jgi:hypothetical protein
VVAELLDQTAHARLVAIGLGDESARLIGHDQAWQSSDELQRVDERADPVGRGLRPGRAHVGVIRRAECRHEDLRLADLAGARIDDGHRLAGVVSKQLLAGDMDLAHRALQPLGPLAVLDAEARVLVGQRVGLDVFLPKQLQRHAGAFELLVNSREVGLEMACRTRHRRAIQPRIEFLIAQGLGERPVHAGGTCVAHDVTDGRLADAQHARTIANAQAGFQMQSKGLS